MFPSSNSMILLTMFSFENMVLKTMFFENDNFYGIYRYTMELP